MMTFIINILTGIFEASVSVMFMDTYVEKKEKKPYYIYLLITFLLAGMINVSNMFLNFGYWNVLCITILFFCTACFFTKNIKSSVIIAIILISILLATELTVLFSIVFLLDVTAEQVTIIESYRVLGTILSKLVAFIIIKLICVNHGYKRTLAMKASYWILFFLIFTFSSLAIYLLYIFQYHSTAPNIYNDLAVWCSFGLLYNTFFSLYLYEKMIKQADAEKKQEVFRQQIKAQAKHMDEILITQKEMKKLRHDLKNHDIAIKAYLDNQDYEGGLAYLQNMRSKTEFSESLIETGNVALDAILNTKRSIAQNKGIVFETQLQIPENLFINPVDICIIFGNALDNAMEACERLQKKEKRIQVFLTFAEESLVCKIVNTAEKTNTRFLHTIKADKKKHGFGIGNIEAALANYKNVHRFSQTEEDFTLFFQIYKN